MSSITKSTRRCAFAFYISYVYRVRVSSKKSTFLMKCSLAAPAIIIDCGDKKKYPLQMNGYFFYKVFTACAAPTLL
jgi:hypothetical protein